MSMSMSMSIHTLYKLQLTVKSCTIIYNIIVLVKIRNKILFKLLTGDYRTREEGCVTGMLQSLELSSLENRRSSNRLIFMYKVVEGLVPAIPPNEFLKPTRQKRQVKAKYFESCETKNILDRHISIK